MRKFRWEGKCLHTGTPRWTVQRALLETWWRKVTGWGRRGPQPRTGPLPGDAVLTARLLVPNWWLRRGYGILEGPAAAVHAVYAHRVRDWERRDPPTALTALATRLLVAGERLWRKLSRAACRKGQVVTWAVLHTAIARGKLCAEPSADFRRRALRRGLDPDGRVTDADLGRDPPDLAAAATKIRLGQ